MAAVFAATMSACGGTMDESADRNSAEPSPTVSAQTDKEEETGLDGTQTSQEPSNSPSSSPSTGSDGTNSSTGNSGSTSTPKPSTGSSSSSSGSSSSSSSSKKPSTGSGSNSTGNSGSSSSSGSSKPSTGGGNSGSSSKPAHQHNWVTDYKTVHHDAEYKNVYHEAVYEDRPIYKWVGWYECKKCGAKLDNTTDAARHGLTVDGGTYTYKEEQQPTGEYEKVLVKDAWTEKVLVKDAWDENVPNGQHCTGCGATK